MNQVLRKFQLNYLIVQRLLFASILVLSLIVRGFAVRSSPPAPYWEEVALGYDAYSILQTGKDHHGNPWPLFVFESFGDDKPAGYFYATVLSIAVFGLNVFAVRLPSILAGTATVAALFFLAKFIGLNSSIRFTKTHWWPYLVMLLAAVNPWAIHFSRAGWEVNLATAFLSWGILLAMWWRKQKLPTIRITELIGSILLLSASVYTYHATRVIVPLLGVYLFWPLIQQIKQRWRELLVGVTVLLIMLVPVWQAYQAGQLSQRFAQTSIFSQISVIEESNRLKEADGNSLIARVIHHRYILFTEIVITNALSHFDLGYLFLHGDANPRHGIGYFGLFYPFDLLFFVCAFAVAVSQWKKSFSTLSLLILWIVIGLLPAAISSGSPHALRTLPIMPALIIFLGLGYGYFISLIPRKLFKQVAMLLILCSWGSATAVFLYVSLTEYRVRTASEWRYGYAEMIEAVERNRRTDERVYITREQGRPAMYYWFYTQTDPRDVQAVGKSALKDQGEFLEFQNIRFVTGLGGQEKGLVAASENAFVESGGKEISRVNDVYGKTVWVIFRKE